MDVAVLSASSALLESLVGALTSLAAAWLTQHLQVQVQFRTALATKRETLYNEFWELREHGKDVRAAVSGTVRVFDPTYARELALAGLGIAYVLEPLVRIDLIGGQLVELLPEAAIIEPGLFLYFPRRAAEARKLRALLDVVREVGRQSATPLSEGAG